MSADDQRTNVEVWVSPDGIVTVRGEADVVGIDEYFRQPQESMRWAPAAEVDRLRAELAETRAERDGAMSMAAAVVRATYSDTMPDEDADRVRGIVAGWRADVERRRSVRGDAPAPAEPPADELPVTLSSPDDVAAVAISLGFVQANEDPSYWKDEHDVLLDVTGEYDEDNELDEVTVQRADDSDVATIHAGASSSLLVAAIDAARGGPR